MVNEEFMKKFDKAHVIFNPYLVSDHSQAAVVIPNGMKKKKKAFKFANFKLRSLKIHLRKLNWQNGNLFDKVEELRNEVKSIQSKIDKDPYNKALRDSEGRYQRNRIESVQDVNGNKFEGQDVAVQFVMHFQKFLGQSFNVQKINDCSFLFYNKTSEDEALSMVNEVTSKKIKDVLFYIGGRGLRQGDPMSPYLFTLVMECFTLMMERNVKRNPKFQYHYGCKSMKITHVCFADDLFILCHGDAVSVKVVRDSINEFGDYSVLLPNFNKSTIFFGSVSGEVQEDIMKVMHFKKGKLPMKYLGVPLIAKRLGIMNFILKEINSLLMGFLWCNGELSRGKAKIVWKKICKPKSHGGLGLKDLENGIRLFCTVKLNEKNFWEVNAEVKDSYWRSEMKLLRMIVSNRSLYSARLTRDLMVADMVSNGKWKWPSEWKNEYPSIEQINVPNLDAEKEDWLVWKNRDDKECKFSIRDVYKDIRIQNSEIQWAKLISNAESHDHLFSNCQFSDAIWKKLKVMMQFQSHTTGWDDIINELAEMPNKSSIWSIVRRLCLASVVYCIWRERNNRVFRDEICNWKVVLEMICETVRLRLMGLTVKNSKAVQQVAKK
ncbi:RNA-directed DNA polymerase, eukaryota, reverse transcriptase zinc-binding domain protein [Tanacetum coccineum]